MYSEENKLQIRKLSEVELQEVTWLTLAARWI